MDFLCKSTGKMPLSIWFFNKKMKRRCFLKKRLSRLKLKQWEEEEKFIYDDDNDEN